MNGAAETMLQSFMQEHNIQSKRHKFYDAKAVEIGWKIDYDFTATNDSLMSYGVIARTLYLMNW